MGVNLLWIMLWCTIGMSFKFPSAVKANPISIDFNKCKTATYPPFHNQPELSLQCCPLLPTKPIIDGPPPPSTNFSRTRHASQCTDATYAVKIEKAYALLRALPDDDPRSLAQQWRLHCAYCGSAFSTSNSSRIAEGIDIHLSWLFLPWHRWYLFFHERILQSLLEDPTFSLNYWNWDGPYTVGDGSSKDGACLKEGDDFPAFFSDSSSSLYDVNRSQNAKGNGRLHFPDLTFSFVPAVQQPLYNASKEDLIASNLNVVYKALVSGGTTAETFMGRPYRAGDSKGSPGPSGGSGSLEGSAHASVHLWTGQDPPIFTDMGQLAHAARDPVFHAHHSNIDRLFQVWKDIGHEYYSDPDFLNAEFLFYDEKKDVRRVKVADALDTTKLGYVYQGANDAAWLFLKPTRCSQMSYYEHSAKAESLPWPAQDSKGYYHLQAGTTFTIVLDRPDNRHRLEEFLTIDGIKLDRSTNAGFDVFVNLLQPTDYTAPSKCAEYNGRFINMAQSLRSSDGRKTLTWKQSITRTLVDIQTPAALSKVVITVVPLSQYGDSETIKFNYIKVET